MAAGLGIDRNLVLDYGRTSAWRLNFKNQTYPSNPGVNPDLIRPKTKKFPLDPQFKPTVQCRGNAPSFIQQCMDKRRSFSHTMLTKQPLFSRVYVFVVLSVPRL